MKDIVVNPINESRENIPIRWPISSLANARLTWPCNVILLQPRILHVFNYRKCHDHKLLCKKSSLFQFCWHCTVKNGNTEGLTALISWYLATEFYTLCTLQIQCDWFRMFLFGSFAIFHLSKYDCVSWFQTLLKYTHVFTNRHIWSLCDLDLFLFCNVYCSCVYLRFICKYDGDWLCYVTQKFSA